MVPTKRRRYFKPTADGVATPVHGYVVKWVATDGESHSIEIKNDGPFSDINAAEDLLQEYLKSGICSWLVSYYD